jgi:hypothetical protein
VIEDDVIRGRTLQLIVDFLQTFRPASLSLYLGHNIGIQHLENVPEVIGRDSIYIHEARRLMLTESLDAATAAFQGGYETPSQFNREYRRLFNAPPLRDVSKLRQIYG